MILTAFFVGLLGGMLIESSFRVSKEEKKVTTKKELEKLEKEWLNVPSTINFSKQSHTEEHSEELLEWYRDNHTFLYREMNQRGIYSPIARNKYTIAAYCEWLEKHGIFLNEEKLLRLECTDTTVKSDENNLKTYLRDVTYRNKPIKFTRLQQLMAEGFFLTLEEEDATSYKISLYKENDEQLFCVVNGETHKIKMIGFTSYGEEERYLARHYFEKVIKENLHKQIQCMALEKEKEREEQQEIYERKQEEELLLRNIEQHYAYLDEKIEQLIHRHSDVTTEKRYQLVQHYLNPLREMMFVYPELSYKNKKEQYREFINAIKSIEQAVQNEMDELEKERVFEFKKQVNVLKKRIHL